MAARSPAVTAETLGAWLVKANGDARPMDDLIRHRFSTVDTWCVRKTYRTDLIEPGQPVLLWISGSSSTHPAGIYAEGRTTGRARPDVADDERQEPAERTRPQLLMPVILRPLTAPVLRRDLLHHPVLCQLEVLTMAAGSNPSYVTPAGLAALRQQWPQVTDGH